MYNIFTVDQLNSLQKIGKLMSIAIAWYKLKHNTITLFYVHGFKRESSIRVCLDIILEQIPGARRVEFHSRKDHLGKSLCRVYTTSHQVVAQDHCIMIILW